MNLLENISAVIFDFDGTLYDNHGQAANFIKKDFFGSIKILSERKLRKQMKGVYLNSYEEFHREYIKRLTLIRHKKPLEKNLKKNECWYENFLNSMVLMLTEKYHAREKVNELFASLKSKGKKVVVLSDYEKVPERMEALKISTSDVDLMYGASELGGLKPAVQIFQKISEELKISPENILVVGDRDDTDGQGARNCGMKFVQIKTIKNSEDPVPENHPFLDWQDFLQKI